MDYGGINRFCSILEKDVDLFLLEEFWSSDRWTRWFYERLRNVRVDLPDFLEMTVEAAHEVHTSDLLVVVRGVDMQRETGVVILIEDKVSASFTKDQPGYRERAILEQKECGCDYSATVLIAPLSYPCIATAGAFDLCLSLEDVSTFVRSRVAEVGEELRRRIEHRALMLEHVCSHVRRSSGGVIPHDGNTRFIRAAETYIHSCSCSLAVKERDESRGKGSYGPGFDLPMKAQLLKPAETYRAELNFNWLMEDGRIRITFHNWQALVLPLHRWLEDRQLPEMSFDSHANTLHVYLSNLPRFDMSIDFDAQRPIADKWIAATERMQAWFKDLTPALETWIRSTRSGLDKS